MSPASRAAVAGKIGPLLDDDLSASEREIAEAVARRLAQDVVVLVRKALAMSVRNSRLLPKDIAYRLAFDVEEVAGPFLEVTDVFGDQELARIAKAVTHGIRTAMARRTTVPTFVARELVDRGNLSVMQALVNNDAVDMDERAFATILKRLKGDGSLLEPVSQNGIVPAAILRELIATVSEKAQKVLEKRHGLPQKVAKPIADEARSEAYRLYSATLDPEGNAQLTEEMGPLQRVGRVYHTQCRADRKSRVLRSGHGRPHQDPRGECATAHPLGKA